MRFYHAYARKKSKSRQNAAFFEIGLHSFAKTPMAFYNLEVMPISSPSIAKITANPNKKQKKHEKSQKNRFFDLIFYNNI